MQKPAAIKILIGQTVASFEAKSASGAKCQI